MKALVKYFKWTPQVIDDLYCDDFDFKGIVYWYDVAIEVSKSMDNI